MDDEIDTKTDDKTVPNGKVELVSRWGRFDPKNIPVIKRGTYEDQGLIFKGGNNGMKVKDNSDGKFYFIKGYARENMSSKSHGLAIDTNNEFDASVKQAMKNKKAIYEYIAIESYAVAELEPPFRSHLFQDEVGRVFLSNDWTDNVRSVLENERQGVSMDESKSERWARARTPVQDSKAFKNGLAMDLVFGMHDLLNADNWKYVGEDGLGEVKRFDFGGPFDVRATSLEVGPDGKQGKKGWQVPENANAIGRWLNEATLSMLSFADAETKEKSVYSGISDETLRASARYMNERWDHLLQFVETELLAKGVHQDEVKDLLRILKTRAKTMKMLAANELPKGEYLSWDPEQSLASKFEGLKADPRSRLDSLRTSKASEPLVATVPREQIKGGGILHTGLVETEIYNGKPCVRVYQTAFAPLNDETVDKKYKDVYQDPFTGSVEISSNLRNTGEMASTCFGIGQPLRALKWVERYMTQHSVNADSQPVVRSFLVPYESYLDLLPGAVRQDLSFPDKKGKLQNVDSKSATDQFELTEQHIRKLQEHAISGTLQTYVVTNPHDLEASDRIAHGSVNSMRALYDKLGVPVFADTLANIYHPWLAGEGHLDQDGVGPKRRQLQNLMTTMNQLGDPGLDPGKAAQLKKFLIQHVGSQSRHLRAVRREMVHFTNISEHDVPPGLDLSPGEAMTQEDRAKTQRSGIVTFFMHEIVASAATQVEILAQHGDWTEALKREEKPGLGEGFEVYAYGEFDDMLDKRRVQHHVPPKPVYSLRQKLADMYTLDKYGPVAVKGRADRVMTILAEAGLLEGRSDQGKKLLEGLIDSEELMKLDMPEHELMDLFISLAIYGDAWMSALEEDQKVSLAKARRPDSAEYLQADLEEIASTRAKQEGKPEDVVRAEINAELSSIPCLEKFTDKGLRISLIHAPSSKHRTDITPYVQLAPDLVKGPEASEYAIERTLSMVKKIAKNDEEFRIWKAVTGEITRDSQKLKEARKLIQDCLKPIRDLGELDKQIMAIRDDIHKKELESPLNLNFFLNDPI